MSDWTFRGLTGRDRFILYFTAMETGLRVSELAISCRPTSTSTGISLLERSGARVKTAQTLARHSDVSLTLNVYTHRSLLDSAAAVERLPGLSLASSLAPRASERNETEGADNRGGPEDTVRVAFHGDEDKMKAGARSSTGQSNGLLIEDLVSSRPIRNRSNT